MAAHISDLEAALAQRVVSETVPAADKERQTEAHKLARILFGMVEGDGRVEGANIYADGYSAPDGDVFVLRAAELLVEQAAESEELTRYVEHFALAAKSTAPPAAPVALSDDGDEFDIDHGETVLRVQKALGITDTGWVSPDIVVFYLEKALAGSPAVPLPPATTQPTNKEQQ